MGGMGMGGLGMGMGGMGMGGMGMMNPMMMVRVESTFPLRSCGAERVLRWDRMAELQG